MNTKHYELSLCILISVIWLNALNTKAQLPLRKLAMFNKDNGTNIQFKHIIISQFKEFQRTLENIKQRNLAEKRQQIYKEHLLNRVTGSIFKDFNVHFF